MSKFNLLIPIAGEAKRFKTAGYTVPKPLITVGRKQMIDLAMDSISYKEANLIFCVRREHVNNFSIDKILRQKFGVNTQIVIVDQLTKGTLCTCLLAKEYINNELPLVIFTPDVAFKPVFELDLNGADGHILTFKANDPAHSYVKTNDEGQVTFTAEKEVISGQAAVGVYCFAKGSEFCEAAERQIGQNTTTNGEFYVCPIYNLFVAAGKRITIGEVNAMHVLGTPEDVNFYETRTLKQFGEKPIVLCSDHSGFEAKELAKVCLGELDIEYIDMGCYNSKDCDQYDFLFGAIKHIKKGIADFGIAFCHTGQAFNMAANKVLDIRSALVYDKYSAEKSRAHNCANFFSIPSRDLTKEGLISILFRLKITGFEGGRHATRIIKNESLHKF